MSYLPIDSKPSNLFFYILGLLLCLLWFVSLFSTPALLHIPEGSEYLLYYGPNEGAPWGDLLKIFNPTRTEAYPSYQAREVGYFFEFLDAKATIGLNQLIPLGFRSVMQILSIVGFVFFLYKALCLLSPREKSFNFIIALFFPLTTHALMAQHLYFRCGKSLVVFFLAVLFYVLVKEILNKQFKLSLAFGLKVYTIILISALTDKQGLLFSGLLIGIFMIWALVVQRNFKFLALIGVAALGALGSYLFYDYQVGPAIIHALHGDYPDRSWSDPTFFLRDGAKELAWTKRAAALLMLKQPAFLLGNFLDGGIFSKTLAVLSWGIAVFLLLSLSYNAFIKRKAIVSRSFVAVLLSVALIVFFTHRVFALFIVRHRVIAHEEIWRGGYYLQGFSLFWLVVFLLPLLSLLYYSKALWPKIVTAFFIAIVALGNYASLPRVQSRHWTLLHEGIYRRNLELFEAIKNKNLKEDPVLELLYGEN